MQFEIRQFMVFIAVGALCATIDVALMQALIVAKMNPVSAASLGFVAGLAANYVLHTRVTFEKSLSYSFLLKFLIVVSLNYAITIIMVLLSIEYLATAIFGKLLSLPIVAVNGFLLSRFWIYK